MPAHPDEIAPDADWLDAMRVAAAAPPALPAWHSIETDRGKLDVQIVAARDSLTGRRLLVIELDAGDETRVLELLAALRT